MDTEKVSGRVLGVFNKGKNRNLVFMGSDKFGRMIVRLTLPDEMVKEFSSGCYVQFSGNPRIRRRVMENGEIVRDVLISKPVIEHVIRTKRISSKEVV